jgi:hypothetical protein
MSKGAKVDDVAYVDFAYLASVDEGNSEKEPLGSNENDTKRVLDSGASKHVVGKLCVFEPYIKHPPTHKGTIQTVDGTKKPFIGVGIVKCTSNVSLSSVLHVPKLHVSLVS